ncbi:TetR/AcrR family transcriptional regulator [Rhodococcus qingshengii]|uniref:TetR/AcrR family transcriptional regulator n=1 Tax=Rhodococcus qingshengii TaxID=334542 RepID=UPI001BEA24E0|nr:TetR/AcrR family transcriptional regulator [Rhodococcus qingshengii]MBT2273590.1 TetR/AcrR family transcriptional regulator [Rhodococcus qingshengii]
MTDQTKVRGGARPREKTSQAIQDACLEEMTERGFSALSMESVAKRAGVGKGALYRRWPDKQTMVASMLSEITTSLAFHLVWEADTLESDMRVFASLIDKWLTDPRVIADLISAHLRDPALKRAVEAAVGVVVEPWITGLALRSLGRGAPDPSEAAINLTGAVFWRRAVLQQEPSAADLARLTQAAALGVLGRPPNINPTAQATARESEND